jgi:hypothetical protein
LKTFTLYSTSACHLCELAKAMIEAQMARAGDLACEEVDISESDVLFERYGLLIPVLQHPNLREMNWPFSPEQLQQFMLS